MISAEWDKYWEKNDAKFNGTHRLIWKVIQKYITPDFKILDIGIGPGVFYEKPSKFKVLVAIDISIEGLKKAQKIYPDGIFIVCDGHKTDLIDGTFDAVILLGVVNYWPDDWGYLLNEARRLVKTGGYIFVSVLSNWNGQHWPAEKIKIKKEYIF